MFDVSFSLIDFEVLAFPCNQFGGQEPGTNQQIKEFACSRFKAEYPIFDKASLCFCYQPFVLYIVNPTYFSLNSKDEEGNKGLSLWYRLM